MPELAALPTLIIWGDGDFTFGDKELRRWQETFTVHETVIAKGICHFVPSDAPEKFAAAIRRWHNPSGHRRSQYTGGEVTHNAVVTSGPGLRYEWGDFGSSINASPASSRWWSSATPTSS